METLNIYIKGVCDYKNGRKGAYSYIITKKNEEGMNETILFFSSKAYEYVQNNFITEIEGITDAIKRIADKAVNIDVFTNSQPLVAILNEEHYGYDYDEVIGSYWNLARERNIAINWVKKSDNNAWMIMVDKKANKYI